MTGFLKRLFCRSISRDQAKRIAGKACARPLDSMEVFDSPPEEWQLYRLEGDEPCWYVRVPSEYEGMALQCSRVFVVSPFKPETAALRAGRLMLEEIHERIRHGKSFAFETTLSGRTYAKTLRECRKQGYHILLVFLSLPNADMAVARVAARVVQGGHNVPETDIRRRFVSGISNFHEVYKKTVDAWTLYDNSGALPKIIERGENK